MGAVNQHQAASDEELASRVRSGDKHAFEALYDRYYRRIFDFAVRIVQDDDAAADVVQGTFTRAWEQLQEGQVVKNIKAWLYAVARNAAIDELRHRGRLVSVEESEEEEQGLTRFIAVNSEKVSEPEAVIGDKELRHLVWSSASALGAEEYSLLDLHLRQGFNIDELAEMLGLGKGALYTRLSRLKDSFEEAVVSVLLVRRGRRDCPELNALVSEFPAPQAARDVHKAVQHHLRLCVRCQESKRRYASPLEIFAGFALAPEVPGMRDAIWRKVSSHIGSVEGWSRWRRLYRRGCIAIGLAILAVLLVSVAVFAYRQGYLTVADPSDVRSTSHQVGQPSSNNVIEMTWSQQLNVQAYSVLWSQNAAQQPEAIANLPGNAAGAQSPPLTPGEWYFNLRTQGKNGLWTSTVHIGPFVISLPQPTATPSYTPTPTFTFTATDMPTPIPTDTPLPTATATHTPRPTNTSTPRPTDTFTPIATDTPTDTPPPPEQPPPPPEQPTPPHPPPPPPP